MRFPFLILCFFFLLFSCEKEQSTILSTEDIDLTGLSIAQIQLLFNSGELTSEQAVNWYLQRIDSIDTVENGLNAIIELNPDAISIAKQMDEERRKGTVRSQLHGIPFVVKDNIETKDSMQTTAGSIALEGNYASEDAAIVGQLRNAGAVLLGKANLSEWANFRSTNSTSGWSSRGGQTKNPYGENRNPCGSSSGSGVAVAANLATFAIGTETNGSIVCPSAINGVVGLKPTVGLISRSGIIPISFTQDSAGPMAKTVEDIAISLQEMVQSDQTDSKTLQSNRVVQKDYSSFLNENGLQGKRIGVLKNEGFTEQTIAVFKEQVKRIEQAGATVVEVEVFPTMTDYYGDSFSLLMYEFKDGLNNYLSNAEGIEVTSLADVIEFNAQNEDTAMPHFGQEILIASQEVGSLESEEYKSIYENVHQQAKRELNKAFETYNLNAIMAPTTSESWEINYDQGDNYQGSSSSLAAWSGFPIISLPMGSVNELPLGVSFFTLAWQEAELIEIAYAYEQQTQLNP